MIITKKEVLNNGSKKESYKEGCKESYKEKEEINNLYFFLV
ncbi:MAG TPA: hypothetical protein PLK34_00255 [Candidatus Pacearchaeota archaeon]|nr:hypothetical protein [Candidatus Pacearchaeota archaeon]